MNKFYYNGELVRTSKTHDYKYAVLYFRKDGTFKTIACSAKRELAESAQKQQIMGTIKELEFFRKMQEAKVNGKRCVCFRRYGHRREETWYVEDFSKRYSDQEVEDNIIQYQEAIENWYKKTKVVELEQR